MLLAWLTMAALANNPPNDTGLFPGDTGLLSPCTGDTGDTGLRRDTGFFGQPEPADEDNDGFDEDVDCDDRDPKVNPDAREVCLDDIDNDCDELVDESLCWPGRRACRTGCEGDQAWLALAPLFLLLRRRRKEGAEQVQREVTGMAARGRAH